MRYLYPFRLSSHIRYYTPLRTSLTITSTNLHRVPFSMRMTRSATRNAAEDVLSGVTVQETVEVLLKRKGKMEDNPEPKKPSKRARATKSSIPPRPVDEQAITEAEAEVTVASASTRQINPIPNPEGEELVPAVLTFSFEGAKAHLIMADPRFEEMFRRVSCKPFERLERVDPFRTLCHSILGQQISWKAARAITHKFVRLFDPSIPEDMTENQTDCFPSANQVCAMDVATLRTAGLSGRKAEYVLDLASKFADGTLSTRKLLEADDEELYKVLTAVRGIGTWTVDMFAMFSLRRPDILPVGDLGVQRGMLRWFISMHSPSHDVSIRKDLLSEQDTSDGQLSGSGGSRKGQDDVRATTPEPAASSAPVASVTRKKGKGKTKQEVHIKPETGMVLPPAFTPSINKTLNMLGNADEAGIGFEAPPLPEGLTVAQMKSRLSGKNKIKGALLTPKEMDGLTESWRPYRSLGVYYMWALSEEAK